LNEKEIALPGDGEVEKSFFADLGKVGIFADSILA
jgi:hypothetical protein